MTTAATSLLGLALPVTGELSGTWGDTVNNSITSLLDTAIAGTTTLSTDGDVTLSTTTLAANQARQAILLCSGARTAIRTITAPAQSKIYTIINATTGGYAVKIVGVGPTTGISIPAGQTATVAWNGSDFVDASNYVNGNKVINGNLTVNGNTTLGDASGDTITINGTTTFSNVNPTLTAGTANGVAYLNGSKVLTTGSVLTFDGTNLSITGDITQTWAASMDRFIGSKFSTTYELGLHFLESTRETRIVSKAADSTGLISFYTGVTPTVRAVIDSSGNLGIGTSSPGAKLDVSGNAYISGKIALGGTTITDNNLLNIQGSNAVNNIGIVLNKTNGTAQIWGVQNSGPLVFFDYTASSGRMTLDTSGNLGLGVTPSAWGSGFRAVELQNGAIFSSSTAASALYMPTNAYYNGANYIYKTSAAASSYRQSSGSHAWFVSTDVTPTAGNAITFTQAMTLDASGNLGLGTTSPGYRLDVQTATSAAARIATSTASASTATLYLNVANNFSGVSQAYIQGIGPGNSGVSQLAFGVATTAGATTATEAMRIDSSGNLGIGTSSPGARLHVLSTSSGANASAIIENAGSTATSLLYFKNSASRQMLIGYTGASYSGGEYGVIDVLGAYPLLFSTNDTERARIDSSGNLLVGTTSATDLTPGCVNVKSPNATNTYVQIGHKTGSITGSDFVACYYAGTQIGGISQNGTTAVAFNTSSDYRLKHDIAPMTGALAKVAALKPVTYKWNADDSDGEGFIAHELAEVCPHAVTGEKDAVDEEGNPKYQGIDTSFLVATLTAAIQEQQALITQLTERITALESK